MSTYVSFELPHRYYAGFPGPGYNPEIINQFPKNANVEILPRIGEVIRFDGMPNNSDYSFRVKEVIHFMGITDETNRVKIYLEN